ncbi:uncharacterized protein LOC109860879 [Pseudomyrmex gracilis]|uniref:uncharacterized protein LOC109860879 n=1 Tax=Pseudomyrmex gracilis TaxID=219809 RepID=UPI0009955E1D|nr:uncharacterized protein LOC109860879 [Pseudomyrmex gracilis]
MDISVESRCKGLELVGLWPANDETVRNRFTSDLRLAIIFVVVTIISGVPLVCALVRVWGDMLLMIDNIQITLPLLVVSLKLGVMRWKRPALLSILNMMAQDWMESKTTKERDVMIERAQIARTIVMSGYVLMILAFVVVIVLPYFGFSLRRLTNLTDLSRPLPLQTYYFYDVDKSPQFELTFIVQAVTILLSAATYTSVDAFLGLAILHFSGQLEIFKNRIAVLTSCQSFICALSNNVAKHLRLIKFAKIIEDTFTLMMLSLVLYFAILFCLHGFLLLTCERVYRAMCELEWYKLKSKHARTLILLMIRANQPFRITAGKIFPLTMTTFCSLLKTSGGYISFLLAKQG